MSSAPIVELSREEIDTLLREQPVGRIGCHADGVTYVVPVIYAYDGEAFHVATVEGQKTRMMRRNPEVCFEVDVYEAGSWRSAIAQGLYEEVTGEEAETTISLLAERFGRGGSTGPSRRHRAGGAATVCFRVRIRQVTGRAVDRRGAAAER
jgi:nitroimidazol reductase NimA-like FMN-containing flavoprotein (pyridoxamine 5'-phosphate oxidase superfamily)